ncbi:MAG: Wzz/FepE/Etk N-terminal domain-containing protein [Candidatus Saganbacteria bacterium]|nr:Wzz/FepE/Etk N-terminal domain-containing protein [Candidatus Saganbacteria bacterium]
MDDEINIKEIAAILARWWKLIAAAVLLFGASAFILSSIAKPVYEAKAKILMRASGGGSSLGALSGLASIAGINIGAGGAGELQGLIDSRKVQDYVSEDLINSRNVTEFVSKEVATLFADGKPADMGKMTAKLEGSYFVITVRHKDPYAAQLISNAYVPALSLYWNSLNASEAKKKIEYIEKEMPKIQAQLKTAEERLKSLTYLNDTQSAIETVEILRAKREVEILNSVYMMLRNQYETAKLDAAKEISPFSDVEPAFLPAYPVSSKTPFNTAIGFIMGLFAGVFAAFTADFLFPKKKG